MDIKILIPVTLNSYSLHIYLILSLENALNRMIELLESVAFLFNELQFFFHVSMTD